MMIPTIFLCILVISLSSAEATNANLSPISTPTFPQKQAEKFIRELNLFPKLDVNIVEDGDPATTADAPRIVEKRFRFPIRGRVANSTKVTVQDLGHHAGYYRLSHTKGARMFYFLFKSRKKNASAPVVIWLTGGPGCSSSLALFYENGPFHLAKDSSLVWNDFGWDQASNLIYIDQPTGTGFSYSTSKDDLRHNSEEAGGDFYDFLQAFLEKHPELAKNDLYITGESYAGHYIPAFAAQINQRNKNKQGIHINLKGLAIGNGLTDPEIQYKAYPDYALDMKLINTSQHNHLVKTVSTCQHLIKACGADSSSSACVGANAICNSIFSTIVSSKRGLNYYDIRKKCMGSLCYDFSKAEKFLNEKAVKKGLGVGDIEFISCSSQVYDYMSGDWMQNFEVGLPALLHDGIKLLIYAGEYDLICNWLGNSRWVESMQWSGQKQFWRFEFLEGVSIMLAIWFQWINTCRCRDNLS
ncbi:SERINE CARBOXYPEPTIDASE-LIKE 49 [Perilla frutescens var. frutescens]|nr:SERINE CARBOXYPEPTIDASE-LIKE 49 [Perilla frutescens var. frutescens]